MARYHSSWYGRRGGRTRNWIYIISALLIIAVVIAVILRYPPFAKNKDELIDTTTEKGTIPSALRPAPESDLLEIALEPLAEPNPKVDDLPARSRKHAHKALHARSNSCELSELSRCWARQERVDATG